MKFNPQPKVFSVKKKPKQLSRAKKPTGEREVFLEIWAERKHECEHCGEPLGMMPNVFFFSHDKPKSTYPELRLEKSNIKLHCMDCHYLKDHGSKKEYESARKD